MEASHPRAKLKYKSLGSRAAIRLVVIHPGSGDEPIRCHLIHTKLGEMAYEALSYEWKEESNDDPTVNVSGENVTVRKNLHDALVHIRLPETGLHIWIDALSIDQSDTLERNAQIKIMGQIYSGALRVIDWLGNAAENSDTALRMLKEIATHATLRRTDGTNSDEHSNQLIKLFNGFDHGEWKALVALCQRPYWSRIWVLQEIHLAKSYKVHCGKESIGDSDFHDSITIFHYDKMKTENTTEYFHIIIKSAVSAHRLAKNLPSHFHTLRRWISATSSGGFVSTNPHDMIYASLGVSSDWQDGRVLLMPNYNKPLPDLFFDVVRIIMARPLGKHSIKTLNRLAECFECTTDPKVKKFFTHLKPVPKYYLAQLQDLMLRFKFKARRSLNLKPIGQ
ncbi:uncharacterized protein EAE97_008257 [Botrytis byssoidea]|uniref:Heterokaryon incompatibility domain-containing protein n=1 Tax=Botrytis byssoidea TaxID=139641 RepID=A0A9P5ICD8_9HELO|nr:uncharacterized protein EAE97_008257 [Botrytis byssoidea]KAF7935350.1 hypothetical protein EAE97_008257 [Botrytis byssoidea]